MKKITLLILIVDRQRAKMFLLKEGRIKKYIELSADQVPQKVKHGDDTWDAQDKIFRHIKDHLHWHLEHVVKELDRFTKQENVTGILIGSHRPLFGNIEKHLEHSFSNIILGTFVTSYKASKAEILAKALKTLEQIEIKHEEKRLQEALL